MSLQVVNRQTVSITAAILLFSLSSAIAQLSAPDADITVDPVIHQFPVTTLDTDSVAKVFTITNHNATEVRTINTLSLGAPHADQYILQNDTCSGATLTANGGSCTISVRFHPTCDGIKSATLLIPSSDVETPILSAFVTTNESVENQAIRRMPPVLASTSIPETLTAGQSYTLTWSLLGYDDNYQSNIVFFNCSGISNGSCGDSYSTNFLASGNLQPDSSQAGEWTYSGITSRKFNYSYTIVAPTVSQPTNMVIRFYSKSQADADAAKGGLSLLIPGNLSGTYYDTAGRRIVKQIIP